MASPLVDTKLFIPRPRRSLVARPRLSERLGTGSQTKLTLVSAPAGFGKTTLLPGWVASATARNRSVAWLSLEGTDSQPAVFWTYLTTALQTVAAGIGADAMPMLQAAQQPLESTLTAILNKLSRHPGEIDLVLDDYHLVDGPEVAAGMAFLLEHLPAQVHVVISTRADPALPLARLRARGELVEVRVADLRFTPDEAADYLNDVTGLNLSAHDIATLEGRTEGWIAALQLAALSMQGRADVSTFIAGFAGDDRYIVDYLVEEVLRRQPDPVRDFLVNTCILERLTGSLCDSVTEEPGGKAMLESLERANLFVVALDDTRHWYRYHHLFADVLRTHLMEGPADEIAGLHRRASQWYEEHGETPSAVRHAVASGDVERAAALVELAIPVLRRARQDATIRGWADLIPDEVVRVRPVLGVGLVGGLMSAGVIDDVERRLGNAERWLDTPSASGSSERMVVVDTDQLRQLPGTIQMYRAALALVRGDLAATVEHARLAVDRAPEDDHLTRAGASALSGLASWNIGDLDSAHRAYSVAVEGMHRVGHLADIVGCCVPLADIRVTRGRLGDAILTYEEALRMASNAASKNPGTTLPGAGDMYVGLSQIALERGDIGAATAYLERNQALGEHLGLPQNPHRWRVATAMVREAQGDLDGALDLLDQAQRVYLGDFLPNVQPIPARRARVLAAQGNVRAATAWAREQVLTPDDELSYLREFEHITLARVLLAQGAADEAGGLLVRLLEAAQTGGRTGSAIEVLALLALARAATGDDPGARAAIERALSVAEPEGYVQVIVGLGRPMAELLEAVAQSGGSEYVHRLVDACRQAAHPTLSEQPRAQLVGRAARPGGRPGERHSERLDERLSQRADRRLVEPLSDRELDVLRLLRTDLDGPAIARELTVSLNTLRTHSRNIYAKLGVNSRRAAVRQAEELDLLARRDH